MNDKLSVLKRARQSEARHARNKPILNKIKRYVKKCRLACASNNLTEAMQTLVKAQSELARGVSKGVLHKNNAARRTSRLALFVKKLSATGVVESNQG